MSFGESISECFRKYATFSGRATRSEYWWFILFQVLAGIAAGIIDLASGSPFGETGTAGAIVSVGLTLPSAAVIVRRLHDINRSGWWFGLPLIVLVVLFVVIFIALIGAGTAGGVDIVALSEPELMSQDVAAQLLPYACSLMVLAALSAVWGIVLFVFSLLDGTKGPNHYGEDPKMRQRGGRRARPTMPS